MPLNLFVRLRRRRGRARKRSENTVGKRVDPVLNRIGKRGAKTATTRRPQTVSISKITEKLIRIVVTAKIEAGSGAVGGSLNKTVFKKATRSFSSLR